MQHLHSSCRARYMTKGVQLCCIRDFGETETNLHSLCFLISLPLGTKTNVVVFSQFSDFHSWWDRQSLSLLHRLHHRRILKIIIWLDFSWIGRSIGQIFKIFKIKAPFLKWQLFSLPTEVDALSLKFIFVDKCPAMHCDDLIVIHKICCMISVPDSTTPITNDLIEWLIGNGDASIPHILRPQIDIMRPIKDRTVVNQSQRFDRKKSGTDILSTRYS